MNPQTGKLYTGRESDFKGLLKSGEIIPIDDGRTAEEIIQHQRIKEAGTRAAKNRAKRARKKLKNKKWSNV